MRMKKIMLAVVIFTLVACNSNNRPSEETNEAAEAALSQESYKGIIPCADCMGIEVVLTLKEDQTFTRVNTYLTDKDGGNPGFTETGTYTWKGDTLHLQKTDQLSLYLKTDTSLIQLDLMGKRIDSPLADHYNLKKVY